MTAALRIAAAALALVLVAATGASSATAQQRSWEIRLESVGTTNAIYTYGTTDIPLPTNIEHAYGWGGDGVFVIPADLPGHTCRIVADGRVVAQASGPGGECRWP